MKKVAVSIPELAFVAGTRAMAGAGIALLLADSLGSRQRKRVGLALLAIGALTTLPIAREVFVRRRLARGDDAADEDLAVLSR